MLIQESNFKRKLRTLSLRIFDKLDNNNNPDFHKNGEEKFINRLFPAIKAKCGDDKAVIFDIGANLGHYSTMLVDYAKRNNLSTTIHAFEPTANTYQKAKEHTSKHPEVTIVNLAASNENGTARIFYDKENSGLASLYERDLDSYNIKMSHSEEIKTIRLEDYISENNIQHIHFLKIDIEGHELKAFEGLGKYANADFIDFIQFEYGGANMDSGTTLRDFYYFFKNKGFRICKIMKRGLLPASYLPFRENFRYANYVAVSEKLKFQ
ncbi:MAG: FkbM family methyltransferase [Bacteroidetes bacterium]|nr:FkbM family methyltransferase [Bacteroidota bacterium]